MNLWVIPVGVDRCRSGRWPSGRIKFRMNDENQPEPKVGDLVAIWRGGRRGGIVALGDVATLVGTPSLALLTRRLGHNRGPTDTATQTSTGLARYDAELNLAWTCPARPISRRELVKRGLAVKFCAYAPASTMLSDGQASDLQDLALLHQSLPDDSWQLQAGDWIRRADLHDRYGGNRSGLFSRSAQTNNAFVFVDELNRAVRARREPDGICLSALANSVQNGSPVDGLPAYISDHVEDGRALRLLRRTTRSGRYQYLGECLVDRHAPATRTRLDYAGPNGSPLEPSTEGWTLRLTPVRAATSAGEIAGAVGGPVPNALDPWPSMAPMPPAAGHVANDRHQHLLEMLIDRVQRSPATLVERSPDDPNFDLAWHYDGVTTIVEVKSTTPRNETAQLRLGLGQLLEYTHLVARGGVQQPRRILFVSERPLGTHWPQVVEELGCELAWPPMHESKNFIDR